jgi:polyhydroxybutyrate depolymerase
MIKLPLLFLLVLPWFGVQAQVKRDSLRIEGRFRTFNYLQPPPSSTGASLIFVLHGSGGTGKEHLPSASKLAERAAAENILLVYPDAYKKYWNECRKASPAEANVLDIDEAAFFTAMITYFTKSYRTDENRVFVIGTSGGGHMAYKLALTIPHQIKAITALIASLPTPENFDCQEAKVPVPVMIVNGTADLVNPYEGGVVVAGNGVVLGEVRSTEQTFAYWSSLAGYRGKPRKETLPDTDPTDGKRIEKYRYQQKGKPEVVLLKVVGGKHDYPRDVDVFLEAWEFFKRQ